MYNRGRNAFEKIMPVKSLHFCIKRTMPVASNNYCDWFEKKKESLTKRCCRNCKFFSDEKTEKENSPVEKPSEKK